MSDYYIHLAGGLGDHLLAYFTGRQIRRGVCGGFGFLSQLKEEQPEARVQLIMHPVQQAASDFFRYHPLIASHTMLPWRNPCHVCPNEKTESHNDSIKLDVYGAVQRWQRKPDSTVYMSKIDHDAVRKVVDRGPFVVIHPFAGQKNRMPIPIKQYPEIIRNIANDFNCNIVVVGATHDRTATKTQGIEEKFKYAGDNIINLVNQTNIRVATRLMQLSIAAITTHSAMFCVAASGDIPIVVTARGKNLARFARQRINASFRDNSKSTVVATSDEVDAHTNTRKIIKCLNQLLLAS